MSTLAIVLVAAGVVVVVAVLFVAFRGRATERRRRTARAMRDRAEIQRAGAERERAVADEQEARARREAAEADERARRAERDRAKAEQQVERAAAIDPDRKRGLGRFRRRHRSDEEADRTAEPAEPAK